MSTAALTDGRDMMGTDTKNDRPPIRWREDRIGLMAGAALALVSMGMAWSRYAHRWTSALDLGLFDQGVWLLSRGRNPQLTIIDDNLFGDHLSPVLALFAPLYRLHPTPLWMIAAQAIALGVTVPAMRSLARQLGAHEGWATLGTVASAPLLTAAMFDFHPIVMTVPITTVAIVAARRDDARTCTIAAVLIALVRADACILLLGVAVLARPAARRRLLTIAPVGMAAGVLVPTLLGSQQTFTRYWGHLGDSPVDALLHPWRVPLALASATALETALIWLVPVGLLTLSRPRWALATFVAGLPLLLSSAPNTSIPWFHTAAALVPFALGGALAALAAPRRLWDHPLTLAVGTVLALALMSPLSPRAPEPLRLSGALRPRPVAGADEALSQVGPDESVSADPWLAVRLARRDRVYMYPCPVLRIGSARCAVPRTDPPPDVVVTGVAHSDDLRAAGWDPMPVPGGDLVVARPVSDEDRPR